MYETEPQSIWWNGAITDWGRARVHVASETALRGLNVFEGIRAYWRPDEQRWAVIELAAHLQRLTESARLMNIPVDSGLVERMAGGIVALLAGSAVRGADLYLRPTVYVNAGRYSGSADETEAGEFVACHSADPTTAESIRCIVSSWRRIPDEAMPTRAKTGAAYTAFRNARIEAIQADADEAILLSTRGVVAETPGAAVFAVIEGQLTTPPLSDGLLAGITRAAVMRIAERELGGPVVERSLTADDLAGADEVFLAGTLDEIKVVNCIDGRRIPDCSVGEKFRGLYLAMCRGIAEPLHDEFEVMMP
ncbi:aminotransferase class IV [Nocardia stercoris]|uniref:Branched-chain-amino-acid transaminase n=1 Tax=Nocardia stercoris TaxID=2483361 RepID=A0A3M2KW60_9NOCA|nr:aminotransferase class IV [Nocardia stercoris]RMI28453.1 branched-chain-amino-acid transaminase [Nocardia stercoris]